MHLHTLGINTKSMEQNLQKMKSPDRLVISVDIMTITKVASCDHHTISTILKGAENELRFDATRTHGSDDTKMGVDLKPRHAGQVCTSIGAPITAENNDSGVIWFYCHSPIVFIIAMI